MGRKKTSSLFVPAHEHGLEAQTGAMRKARTDAVRLARHESLPRSLSSGEQAVYRMAAARVVAGTVDGAEVAAIVTPAEQWAYALVVPVSLPQRLTQRLCIKLTVLVHHGAIGIGVLTRSETRFHQEIIVRRASAWQDIELVTPPIGETGPLVIRNASEAGVSRAQCCIAAILSVGGEVVPGPVQRGSTVVDTSPRGIETIFSSLSDDVLLAVAKAVADLKPLAPIPNWRFSAFETSAELAVHIRHSVWLAARARALERPVVVPWYGGTRLALRLDNDLSHSLFACGCFEPNEFALIDRVLQPGMVFVDGGANEGAYTVFAAARVGPAGRVIAVEPSRRETERLKLNLDLNEMERVELVEAALAECAGPVKLTIAEREHAGLNTLGAFFYDGIAAIGTEIVAATTLDELVAERRLPRLDIVKLDLEGAELRALLGARRALAELKPLLLIELSDAALKSQGGSQSALFELLRAAGYVVLTFGEGTGEPVPLRSAGIRPSPNIVAVHAGKDWGLLGKRFQVAKDAR
jgi:FkbM family methyltransferase